jgi:hypothetical protein
MDFCKADIAFSLLFHALTRFHAVVSQSMLLFPTQHCPTSPLAHHRLLGLLPIDDISKRDNQYMSYFFQLPDREALT